MSIYDTQEIKPVNSSLISKFETNVMALPLPYFVKLGVLGLSYAIVITITMVIIMGLVVAAIFLTYTGGLWFLEVIKNTGVYIWFSRIGPALQCLIVFTGLTFVVAFLATILNAREVYPTRKKK